MRIREHSTPRPHVVVDDCLSEADLQLFLEHLRGLEPRMTVGMVRKRAGFVKDDIKENRVLFVDDNDKDSHAQGILESLRALAWSDRVLDFLEGTDAPLFQVLQYTEAPSIQISRYVDSGQYGFHKDIGNKTNLTVLFFACVEPQGFQGGNFVMEHKGERKTIRYRNNRLLIFPSSTLHRVTPVKADGDRFECARFSLQIWPAIAPGKAKGPRSMQALRREDQARHPLKPTFTIDDAVKEGSTSFYKALFADEPTPLQSLDLGSFGRLGGRLLSNLQFLASSIYPQGRFQGYFHNRPGDANGVETRILLVHGDENEGVELGYRLRAKPPQFSPLQSELYVRITIQGDSTERSARTSLKSSGAQLEQKLKRLSDECTRDVDAGALPKGLRFLEQA